MGPLEIFMKIPLHFLCWPRRVGESCLDTSRCQTTFQVRTQPAQNILTHAERNAMRVLLTSVEPVRCIFACPKYQLLICQVLFQRPRRGRRACRKLCTPI